jgi:DNA-binding protein H-NS
VIIPGRTPIAIIGEVTSEKFSAGYRDLLAQREALDQQIEALRSVERRDVINWIFEQMAIFEIKPEDLGSPRGPRKHSGPVAAKYRDPHNRVLPGLAVDEHHAGWRTRTEKNS